MNADRFDKILERYWDDIFKDCELKPHADGWTGMVTKDNKMIVGYIEGDEMWYYDGNILQLHEKVLGISLSWYKESMKNYLNRKFNLNIMAVM